MKIKKNDMFNDIIIYIKYLHYLHTCSHVLLIVRIFVTLKDLKRECNQLKTRSSHCKTLREIHVTL